MPIRAIVIFISCCSLLLLTNATAGKKKLNTEQPNIVFIMADDQTSRSISAYGDALSRLAPTPNIDRLANEGAIFKNLFATNAICSPSRASILTGAYSHRHQVYTVLDSFNQNRNHLGHWLQDAGYQTFMIGKWHLRSIPEGFDYYFVLEGQGSYFDPQIIAGRGTDFKTKSEAGYVTDILTKKSKEVIWLANRNEMPFCLFLHHKAPHSPYLPHPNDSDYVADTQFPLPENFEAVHHPYGRKLLDTTLFEYRDSLIKEGMMDANRFKGISIDTSESNTEYQSIIRSYLQLIKSLDRSTGQILDYLDSLGLAENTIVIYTSDQGILLGEHNIFGKRWMYDESIRMPFLIRYPGHIKAGKIIDQLAINVDIAPTILNYANANVPISIQGKSLKPLMEKRKLRDWREEIYYRLWPNMGRQDVPAHFGLRTEKHKLIYYYGKSLDISESRDTVISPFFELFDLKSDPNEMVNRYNDPAYSKIRTQLKKDLWNLKNELGDTADMRFQEFKKRSYSNSHRIDLTLISANFKEATQ